MNRTSTQSKFRFARIGTVAAAAILVNRNDGRVAFSRNAEPARPAIFTSNAAHEQFSPKMFQEMRWRNIGPFRAGRTRALAGVPSQPNVFYIGGVDSGVWKSDDYGETWKPIFDDQPTGSIGAIAVADSDPQHYLCRLRRRIAAPRSLHRRRNV